MNAKTWIGAVVVLLIAMGAIYILMESQKSSNIVRVPGDYPTVSQALARAAPGTIIELDARPTPYELNISVHVEDVWIRAASGRPVIRALDRTAPAIIATANQIRISGFRFERSEICVGASDVIGFHIEDNVFLSCGAGLAIENTQNAEITNNRFEQNRSGIKLIRSKQASIEQNHFEGNFEHGLNTVASSKLEVSNNEFTHNYVAMGDHAGEQLNVSGNVVVSNEFEGLLFNETQRSTIADNEIRFNYDGITLQAAEKVTVKDNVCAHQQEAGIKIVGGGQHQLFRNDCNQNTDGLSMVRSASNLIQKNQIHDNLQSGILLKESSQNELQANQISLNRYGISFQSSEQNMIAHNDLKDNDVGVRLSSSGRNALSFNLFSHNKAGVEIGFSSNNVVKANSFRQNVAGLLISESQEIDAIANTFESNQHGIGLIYSERNTLIYNAFLTHSETALSLVNLSHQNHVVENQFERNELGMMVASSLGNTIERNNFVKNAISLSMQLSGERTKVMNNTFEQNDIGIHLPEFIDKVNTLLRGTEIPLEILGSNEGYLIENNRFIANATAGIANEHDLAVFARHNHWGAEVDSAPLSPHVVGNVETQISRLKGPVFVASMSGIEQRILGELAKQMLQQNGFGVVDMTNLGPAHTVKDALMEGIVDLAWWHSAWTDSARYSFNGSAKTNRPLLLNCLNSPTQLGVAQMRAGFGEENKAHPNSLSAWFSEPRDKKLIVAMPREFIEDPAGFGAFGTAYGFSSEAIEILALEEDDAVMALSLGDADAALLPQTTAARDVFNVVFLSDDLGFFKQDFLCPVVLDDVAKLYPDIATTLNLLAQEVREGDLRMLKGKVQFFGESVADVVNEFLVERAISALKSQ